MNQETPSAGQPAASEPLGTAQSIRPYAQPAMAWVVLVVCLLGTAVGWRISLHQLAQRSHDRFILHTERVLRGIEARMQGYEQVLKGAVGLFAASKSVERAEWRDYVSRLEINKRYPGIRALGYIAHVPLGNAESFIMSNRVDGAGEFAIQPAATGNRSSRYVMQFIEPLEGNSASVGYDIASESRQREAAELARDRNETVLTARIKLVQSYEDLPAVLLLVPVYKNGWPVHTLEQRRAAIDGWVCAAFIMADLMAGVIESSDPEIDFEIFDGNRASLQSVLYDDDGILHGVGPESSTYHTNAPPLSLANRTWTIHFSTRPAFDAATDESETRLLAFGGVFISFLLFGITRSLVSTRRRALGR